MGRTSFENAGGLLERDRERAALDQVFADTHSGRSTKFEPGRMSRAGKTADEQRAVEPSMSTIPGGDL